MRAGGEPPREAGVRRGVAAVAASAAVAVLWVFWRLWRTRPLSLGAGAAAGLACGWVIWPVSAAWALAAIGLPLALPLSLALHEAGHAAAALALGRSGVLLAAGPRQLHVSVPVGPGDRRVAAAGPAAAVLPGGALAALGVLLSPALAALALPFLAHAAALLPLAGDGRRLWGLDIQTTGGVR